MEVFAALLYTLSSMFSLVAFPAIILAFLFVWVITGVVWYWSRNTHREYIKFLSMFVFCLAILATFNLGVSAYQVLNVQDASEEVLEETIEG